MVKMKLLFVFINDLEKIIYGIELRLILKRNNNYRALFRVNEGAGAVANECNMKIRGIILCVLCIDPSNENRIIVQEGLKKKNYLEFNFYENKFL